MLIVCLRLAFVIIGLIFLSEIPTTEKVFFNARFAFYGMIFVDFVNVYKSNKGFEKHYAGVGWALTGLITFFDGLGVIDIIVLDKGKVFTNPKFDHLLGWVPAVSVESYIVTFSLFTIFFYAAELVLVFQRNLTSKKRSSRAGESVLDT